MPRVEFKAENKVATTNYDYPKLKLKVGERARVLLLEDPVVEYVHTLRKPQIINGIPQMFTDKRRDGSEFEANKMDFLSRPLCLGDATILADKGSDPKNCPMCKMAQTNPDFTGAPQRRYAMHVIRYRTKAGTTDLLTPYSVETLVWAFTDTIFNKLVDFKEEWGDLRKHDLLLGPCQVPEHFQKFDITVAAKAGWMEDAERQKLTVQTFRENQIPDLTIACGSVKEKHWIEEDLAAIQDAWKTVSGAEAEPAGLDSTSLDDDLGGLLGGSDEKWADSAPADDEAPKSEDTSSGDVDDLLGSLDNFTPDETPEAEETPVKEAPAKAATKAKKVEPAVDNFDDLLKGM